MFFYHAPAQRPPHATGHCVDTVTLGGVGAPNERTPFRIHGAVVGFVDRCLSRTRNLAAFEPSIRLSFSQADLLAQHRAQNLFFFGLFQKFGSFRLKKRVHSKLAVRESV